MTREEIASALRAARRAQDLTQEQLGSRLNAHRAQVSAWERCDGLTLETLLKWAEALGLEVVVQTKLGQDVPAKQGVRDEQG